MVLFITKIEAREVSVIYINEIDVIKKALDNLQNSQAEARAALDALEQLDLSEENTRLRESVELLNKQLEVDKQELIALRQTYVELVKNFKNELASKRSIILGLSKTQYQEYLNTGLAYERGLINEQFIRLQNTINQMYPLFIKTRCITGNGGIVGSHQVKIIRIMQPEKIIGSAPHSES